MDDACAVCAEPIEWVAYGACGHREVCSVCVARLRFVLRDQRCCLCMTHCPAVFVTKALGDRTKVISDLSVLPAPAGEGKAGEYWYHEGTQVWFDDVEQYRAVRAMCQISCTVCKDSASRGNKGSKGSKAKHKKKIGSMEQLKGHLFNHHQLYMCDLCLDGRKVFNIEQKLYTRPQLNKHMKNGDPEVDGSKVDRKGFRGHPMCEFCKIPFYGQDEIYTHMTREHYSCHMCQRQHCRNDDYFRNYDELEMHFRSDHFFCEDRECLEKKFIVFQSEAELKRHNTVEHKERKPHANKNATTFKVLGRGSGIQAASVPVYLRPISGQASQAGQSSGPNHVLQQSYSSLSRQEVSGARIGSGFQEASSPPVSEQSSYTPALSRSSWTAAIIRDEEFPPLPGSSNRNPALTQRVVRKVAENTHASGLRQQSKGVSVHLQSPENTDSIPSGSRRSPSCPTPNPSCPMPNPSPKISGSLSLTSAENERLAANTFLVERMQTALGMDHDRYVMFKEISGEYHQGVINASSYLLYVEQFGLSHLVLEMARLLPDPHKQKELADAYYANLRLTSLQGNGGGGTVSSRKNKGKGKLPDAAETTSPALNSMKDKFLSTANKLQLQGGDFGALLREGCGATVKGARQIHGGHRLSLSKTKK